MLAAGRMDMVWVEGVVDVEYTESAGCWMNGVCLLVRSTTWFVRVHREVKSESNWDGGFVGSTGEM